MSDDVERYIVCNGDADGLCAALQWRWHDPRPATLITGLKRDVELLRRVPPTSAREVVVFDLSMPRNARALTALLEHGVNVRYFDHHAANTPVRHPRLQAHLDSHANVCTCVLVDRYLHGARRAWAVVGAWGDNLASGARRLARLAELSNDQCETLRMLGEAINYNAYGDTEADVLIAPARLYDLLASYRDPLDAAAREPVVAQLMARQADDLRQAKQTATYWQGAQGRIVVLPDEAWARRISGTFANQLALDEPACAHAVLKPVLDHMRGASYLVSVRAPIARSDDAAALCQQFGGTGRVGAAGIDRLPSARLDAFVAAFQAVPWTAHQHH